MLKLDEIIVLKTDPKEIFFGGMYWIHVSQDKDRWQISAFIKDRKFIYYLNDYKLLKKVLINHIFLVFSKMYKYYTIHIWNYSERNCFAKL